MTYNSHNTNMTNIPFSKVTNIIEEILLVVMMMGEHKPGQKLDG